MIEVVALVLVFALLGTVSVKHLKNRHQLMLADMQHRQRLELLQRSEQIVQLLVTDKEMGWAVHQQLSPHWENKQLPPPSVVITLPKEPVVHFSERHIKQWKKGYIESQCGLRSGEYKFHSSSDETKVTCKRCLKLLWNNV